jgi:hypothetical protein
MQEAYEQHLRHFPFQCGFLVINYKSPYGNRRTSQSVVGYWKSAGDILSKKQDPKNNYGKKED